MAQRPSSSLLYRLLVGRDTGPRLPTLLLAVGADRVRHLLGAADRRRVRPTPREQSRVTGLARTRPEAGRQPGRTTDIRWAARVSAT